MILQVKTNGLISVSVSPIMQLFLILSSLIVLSTCFESEITL